MRAHNNLSFVHYCFAATRRLIVLCNLSAIIEDVHVLNLLTTFNDLATLYREQYMCAYNTSLCMWNTTGATTPSTVPCMWELLCKVAEFQAYVDRFEVKVVALVSKKCVDLPKVSNFFPCIAKQGL